MSDESFDILAIGAHAGDMEISCGPVIAHEARLGKKTLLLHMTPGEKGHKTLSPEEYAALKKDEAQKAADILGAECLFLPYGDAELYVTEEVKWEIADIIRKYKPKVILSHWKKSIHKDHAAACALIPDARFYASLPAFHRVDPPHWVPTLYYTDNWEDHEEFHPEVFCEISKEDLEIWEEACRKYSLFRGEVSPFPYLNYYKALFTVRGLESSYGRNPLAVAFAVPPDSHRRTIKTLL